MDVCHWDEQGSGASAAILLTGDWVMGDIHALQGLHIFWGFAEVVLFVVAAVGLAAGILGLK